MTKIRPLALVKQVAAIPFHFARHQWKSAAISQPEKHMFGRHPRQYLMFWMPPETIKLRQHIIIFYHGGGWRFGWPDQFPTVADWFLQRGYAVFMPAYRLLPRFAFSAMREDLNLGLGKMLEIMQQKGLVDKKLVSAGMSAGATLAAHLLFNRNEWRRFLPDESAFSGFMAFGGPLDMNKMPDLPQIRSFSEGNFQSAAFRQANPVTWLEGNEQWPALLVHGADDAIVPLSSAQSFYDQYSGPKKLHILATGSHLDSLGWAIDDVQTSSILEKWLESSIR